jgi:hypothetical protein
MYSTTNTNTHTYLLFLTRFNTLILPETLLVRSILILLPILHSGVPSGRIQKYVSLYPYVRMIHFELRVYCIRTSYTKLIQKDESKGSEF